MNATDLAPSRLARARYKIEDVLALDSEGRTGLVAYAGDAFTVSPLTRDVNTVRALLKALEPDIMPVQGSRAERGLAKAGELLRQAGSADGQVLLIADGIAADNAAAAERAAAKLHASGYRVSVVGVGGDGLEAAALRQVARAGGGAYQSIAASSAALRTLLSDGAPSHPNGITTSEVKTQAWKAFGPFLVILLLPLAALAFRRNWLLSGVLLIGLMPPPPAMASTWDDLWQRPDQQATKALAAGDYATASKIAKDPDRRGSALYKLGNYQKALDDFVRGDGAAADYNRGNTLAKLGRYQEAVAAYDQSLKEKPGDADALANKAAVEELLKKQSPQKQAQAAAQNGTPKDKDAQHGKENGTGKGNDNATGDNAKGSQQEPASGTDKKDAAATDKKDATASDKKDAAASDKQQAAADGKDQAREPGQQQTDKGGSQPGPTASASAQHEKSGMHAADADGQKPAGPGAARAPATEQQLATEQWLRRIPDDPGGLLRRKFLYQYRQRAQQADRI